MHDHREGNLGRTRTGARRRRPPIGVRGLLLVAAVVTGALLALAGPGDGGVTSVAEADHPLPAPAALTAVSGPAAGAATLHWTAVDGAAAYRVHWLSAGDLPTSRDDESWVEKLGTADTGETNQYTVTGLNPGAEYFFIVGVRQDDGGIAWSHWDRLILDSEEQAATRAFVQKGIDYFGEHGMDATLAHYNSRESVEGERALMILRGDDNTVLASAIYRILVGSNVYTAPGTPLGVPLSMATPEGHWITDLVLVNPATGQKDRALYLVIRSEVVHEGQPLELIFASGHFPTREEYAKDYVQRAVNYYDREGRDATIDFYNDPSSIEGEFYLFLIGADDLYLAHPVLPHLIGTDIKTVTDSSGYELGKEIAKASESGHWVDYLWPDPVTRIEAPKSAWVIRHDGLIFASGYYSPDPDAAPPAWKDADPREYTVTYVENAIARYERDGLEAFQRYYNSVGSFEGQWYLFATDANDHYILHPLFSRLIGTDINNVVDSSGYALGKDLAAATEAGVWVEYLWPHPFTLQDAPKVAYAKRHDGLLFASGYYPVKDPRTRTREYVADAIAYYESEGLDAASAYYNSPESIDGQWTLTIVSAADGEIFADGAFPNRQGGTIDVIQELNVTEAGLWLAPQPVDNPLAPEANFMHIWAVLHDGLVFMSAYFSSDAGPEPQPTEDADEALTRAYVLKAVAYYEANGLDATTEQYRSDASVEDGRSLTLIDAEESVLLVYRPVRALEGQYVGPGSRFAGLGQLAGIATAEGRWENIRGVNPVTKQEEPRRVFVVLHDGLAFSAGHSTLVEDVSASVQEYVRKATAMYDQDGRDAVIAHYNSQDSLEGQFYLFLIDADDLYLAHPIFPHLIGTDIKDVVGSDGQELGKEIALATADGDWVEYLWPHPVTRNEQQKVTWAIRHDGLIFASGYYAGAPETGSPAWRDADPREYTVQYVRQAIERYEQEGLESFLNYYNSVASFEGQWYLFATDADDIYHVHPLIGRLIGTDIKDVKGSDGYELGKELAEAVDGGEGVWVEYLWPHPVTLKEVLKVGYAVRHDGMLFASGYYPQVEDPAGQTQAYVNQAIEYYQANGLDATVTHYNSQESLDGQWSLTMADENDIVLVAVLSPHIIGTDLKGVGAGARRQIGKEMTEATEEGAWISFIFPNTRSSETLYAHVWAIRHDGLLFTSRYYDDLRDVPGAP